MSATVFVYDISSNKWSQPEIWSEDVDKVKPRWNHFSFLFWPDDKMLIIGGQKEKKRDR